MNEKSIIERFSQCHPLAFGINPINVLHNFIGHILLKLSENV
jgi:hypothetical protein